MKIIRLQSGNYRAQVPLKDVYGHVLRDENGKRMIVSVTAPTKAEVERQACQIMGARHAIVYEPEMTVYEAMEGYCNYKNNVLSQTTLRGYRKIRETRLQDIMNIPISKLEMQDVQAAINKDANRLGYKSIKEAVSHLKTVLRFNRISLDLYGITIKRVHKPKIKLPLVSTIISAIMGTPIELACYLAIFCSLRVGEVRGLQFRDISEDGKYITIQRERSCQDGVDYYIDSTKTEESARTIRLPESIYKMIMKVPHDSDTDYIIPVSYRYIYYHFTKAMKANNIKGITFHKLRHVFASVCKRLGINDVYTMEIGGWSTPYVMNTIYTHLFDDDEEMIRNTIDNYLLETIHKVKVNGEHELN